MRIIKLKRVYEECSDSDGIRILVDRLWPRGLKKELAKIDFWEKEIAPSDGLRKWFAHDPKKWLGFESKYLKELEEHKYKIKKIKELSKKSDITLLYAAKDTEHNNAIVILEKLKSA